MRKIIFCLCLVFLMVLPACASKKLFEAKWINIDKNGNIIKNIDAYSIKKEHSDLRKIVSDEELKMGFENSDGSIRIEPIFDLDWRIEYFDDDYLSVAIDKKWGVIDRRGNWVVYPISDIPLVFKNDMAVIKEKGKYGAVSMDGYVSVKPDFDIIEDFSEDLAAACKDGACGFIDKSGDWHIEPKFPSLVCLYKSGRKFERKPDCNFVSKFDGGMAPVLYENINDTNGSEGYYKSGYINTDGKVILDGFWNDIGQFSEGLAPVQYHENKWGYINRSGRFVIPAIYEKAEPFDNHYAKVVVYEKNLKSEKK